MMLTTGISMLGKMSVGVRTIANAPRIKIRIANTAIVYGRLSASLTIHISYIPSFRPALTELDLPKRPKVCALESWHPVSRQIARLLGARRPFPTAQFPGQEFSGRTDGGCRH